MQTCSRCNTHLPDSARICSNCQADLAEFSVTAQALKRMRENPRVRHVILQVWDDACPACRILQGAHSLDNAPVLPVEGCSHPNGCRCKYQPVLTDIYP